MSSISYAESVLFLLGPVLTHKTHLLSYIQEARETLKQRCRKGHLNVNRDLPNKELIGRDLGRATCTKSTFFFLSQERNLFI